MPSSAVNYWNGEVLLNFYRLKIKLKSCPVGEELSPSGIIKCEISMSQTDTGWWGSYTLLTVAVAGSDAARSLYFYQAIS